MSGAAARTGSFNKEQERNQYYIGSKVILPKQNKIISTTASIDL